MKQNNVEGHLWKIRSGHPEWELGLNAIDASYRILENSISQFVELQQSDDVYSPILAYGYAKLVIIESWTIHSNIFYTLKKPMPCLDTCWPSLKIFRDAISHLDERVQGRMLVNRKKVGLKSAKGTLAGGLAVSEDGVNWDMKSGLIFNFKFDGIGAVTPFGMIGDYVLTNTSEGIEEIQVNRSILDAVDKDILALD